MEADGNGYGAITGRGLPCIAVLCQVVWLVGLTSYSSRMIDLMPN